MAQASLPITQQVRAAPARAAAPASASAAAAGIPFVHRHPFLRYVAALAATVGTFLLVRYAMPTVGSIVPLAPMLAVVIAAAYLAGPGPAVACIFVSAVLVDWFFFTPHAIIVGDSSEELLRLGMFVGLGLLVSLVSGRWRSAHLSLRDREQKLRILLEKMPVVLWSTDRELRLTSSSAAMAYLFAAAPAQERPVEDGEAPPLPAAAAAAAVAVLPEPVSDLFRRLPADSLPAAAQRRAAAGEAVSYDWACGERHFHVHVEPLRGEGGAISGTFGMAWDVTAQHRAEGLVRQANQQLEARVVQRTDELAKANLVLMQQITERKKAEADRRRVEEELRNVIRNARCMLWHAHIQRAPGEEREFADLQPFRWTTRLYDEAAARQMLQLDPNRTDLSGQALTAAWRASIPAEDREAMDRTSDAALLSGGAGGYTQEYRWVDPGGSVHWLLETVSLQRRAEDRWWAVGVVTDITARKLAEAQRDAQRDQVLAERSARAEAEAANRAKDQFLATLSHELRTPMTPVLLTVSHLESEPRLPEDVRASLRMIRRNVELEARLIDDLLDLTRIARGKLDLVARETDVHSLLCHARDVCRPDADAKRLRIELREEAERCFVRGDATRLEQVFWNLVRNAVKFTPDGGAITLRTANDAAGRLVIEVRDTGVGIGPELLPRIFDAFEQGGADVTKRFGGLGLGLAISKALIDLHGGTLSAHSDGPGAGATFTVTLDTVEAPVYAEPVAPAAPPAAAGSGQQIRILLVEDHADTRKATARLLRLLGHDVATADCVTAGLRAAESRIDPARSPADRPERPFDLVISDLGLPDGSGHDLVRQLKARFGAAGLKAVALSGFGMDADIRASEEAGFDAHLVKPVSIEQIEAAVRQVAGMAVEAAP